MAKRHPNHRLVKIHRNYTVEEIADLLGVHKGTVRNWFKAGLQVIDSQRPKIVLGVDLIAFLQARKTKNRRRCEPGEIYCVRCKAPQVPAGMMADYQPQTAVLGNLIGICPDCQAMIYRRVNFTKMDLVRGKLDIAVPQGLLHISGEAEPSGNSDFKQDGENDE